MFLKQEKPEMDDFEKKIKFGSKRKILRKILYFKKIFWKNSQAFNGYLSKNVTKYFGIFFCFRTFYAWEWREKTNQQNSFLISPILPKFWSSPMAPAPPPQDTQHCHLKTSSISRLTRLTPPPLPPPYCKVSSWP